MRVMFKFYVQVEGPQVSMNYVCLYQFISLKIIYNLEDGDMFDETTTNVFR